jgi:hypothetical protein
MGSDAIVYAHCASNRFGDNGTVTIFAANPSSVAVMLDVALPSRPRYVNVCIRFVSNVAVILLPEILWLIYWFPFEVSLFGFDDDQL